MQEDNYRERRLVPRFSIDIPLKYLNATIHKVCQARTFNISSSGLGLATEEEIATGTVLDIWLSMPDNHEQIPAKGQVVWSKKVDQKNYLVGVSLSNYALKPIPIVLRAIQAKF
jgi:Tfp pilus assembly protein PilZ